MKRVLLASAGVLVLGLFLIRLSPAAAEQPVEMRMPAPELKGIDEWINSKPLTLKDLKGKVVALHFWTFG